MSRRSRAVVAGCSLLLLLLYALPLWRIDLVAPQYPEGLGMHIRIDAVEGVAPNDLENINILNHYIGMKPIRPDAIPELRIMPWVVGGLVLLGLATAALGRRRLLYAWTGAFAAAAVAGLADFRYWLHDYGHNLDHEHAIIKIPGMSYDPPLIGSKQILNFTAESWPAAGGWIAIAVGLAAALVLAAELRGVRRPPAIH